MSDNSPATVTKQLPDTETARNRIDLSKAIEMRYKHRMSYQQIADHFGVVKSAVIQRMQKFSAMLQDPHELEAFKNAETMVQDAIRTRYSHHLLTADLEKVSPRDAAIIYGTIYDKNRLSTGQSTANLAAVFSSAMDDE